MRYNVGTSSFTFLDCIMLLNMAHALNMWLGNVGVTEWVVDGVGGLRCLRRSG
jgi:hypothetical protein